MQSAQVPDNIRIYAIGDVHGRADLLENTLLRINSDIRNRPIRRPVQVLVGDYIDRGPDSKDVIDLLLIAKKYGEVVALAGNHEFYLTAFLKNPLFLKEWRNLGGLHTLASYGVRMPPIKSREAENLVAQSLLNLIPDDHLDFFQRLPSSYCCGDFFFAHAGIRPGIPLEQQSNRDLLNIRQEFLSSTIDFGKVVVHGHTPVEKPDIKTNRINIDTGAYATGHLTCLVIEQDRLSFLPM
jgi:serine/threonine protein phosphatase 1